MEVSSHALALGRVDGVRFAVGAFTNLSQDHLDFHHTMQAYFDAKALLFAPSSPNRALASVICVDDEWGRRMAGVALPGGRPVTVSTGSVPAQWHAGESVVSADGTQHAKVTVGAEPNDAGHAPSIHELTVSLPGRYNVANALLAVAVATTAGVSPAIAFGAVADVEVPGRLQRIDRGQDFLVVVDYAHKPAAVQAVITTLRRQTAGRVGVVVGAGGNRDTGKRPLMGEMAARGADLVIITDDNPRTEDPAAIRAEVLTGARAVAPADRPAAAEEIGEIGDRAAAIRAALEWARAGDVVVIAGKGHEAGQEINGVKHPFDDRVVAADVLDSLLAASTAGDS